MKNLSKVFCTATLLCISIFANAQNSRPDKLYSMSGIGLSLPVGETTDYLKPKISTTLGLNVGIGHSGLFLYPQASLHVYNYNGLSPDDGFTYTGQNSRASTYLLNMALGYRKFVDKFAFYGYAGGGGGLILTPTFSVDDLNKQVNEDSKSHGMGIIEIGAGAEYNIGDAALFVETSYMRGFNKIQDRSFATIPITIGIKPNLNKLLKKMKKL